MLLFFAIVITYIAIGLLMCVLAVKLHEIDPYDDDIIEAIACITLIWIILLPMYAAYVGCKKFGAYLKKIYDKLEDDDNE